MMAGAVSAGTVHSAGGPRGWDLGVSMGELEIDSGDSVRFKYVNGQHDVCQVSKEDYDNCNSDHPWACYYSGADEMMLYNSDTYFYVCSISTHCLNGMKVKVIVR